MEARKEYMHVTIRELLNQGCEILREHGIANSDYDAKALLMHFLACDYSRLFLLLENEAEPELIGKYLDAVRKRSTHYPLQYIIGTQGFMGYEFLVNEHVLIPRQDTEVLLEQALLEAESRSPQGEIPIRVLDLCTGSGCIGISYYLHRKNRGYHDYVMLTDISKEALLVAEQNAKSLSAEVEIIESDLFDRLREVDLGSFDLILSNPPYIKSEIIPTLMPEVKDYEPMQALDGYVDGLYFYRKIIEEAGGFLNNNGVLMFEIGYDQAEAVQELFAAAGYVDITLTKDYAGLDRVVSARYCK